MKKLFLTLAFTILSILTSFGQEKYITKSGHIVFQATAGDAFEEIKANNSTVTSILNTDTGDIAALALMKGFRFKIALMEEHFNENYVESDTYPKAKFSGKLEGFSKDDLTYQSKEYPIKGELTLHGKSKKINAIAKVKRNGEIIQVETEFIVKSEDFNIKIPSIVREKIAEDIEVSVVFKLQKKQFSK